MKKFNFHAWHSIGYQGILGIFSLFFLLPQHAHSQKTKAICGVHTKIKADLTGNESGVYLVDRFGNKFDTSEDIISIPKGSDRKMNCGATGYFNLNYIGGPWAADEEATICAVFGYIAGFVDNPNGNTVEINVVKEPFNNPNVLATGTSLYEDFSPCTTRQNLVWIKMHSDYVSSPGNADGLMRVNANISDWHTLAEDNGMPFSEYDLYTVALHEALHIMGFSSRINENGGATAGFFSEWDHHLFSETNNAFLLVDAANPTCCGEVEFNSAVFPNLPDDLITNCAGNHVINFGTNNLAEVNANFPNGNSLNNYLSHLCATDAVMFASLAPGDDSRRELSDPEVKILCELGYTAFNCDAACILQANLDSYGTLANSITITYADLISNDAFPPGSTFEILDGCGDWNNVTVVENANDMVVSGLPQGFTNLCYSITGCDGECNDGTISILRIGNDPGGCDSSDEDQELVMGGDLEGFTDVTIQTNAFFNIQGGSASSPNFYSVCNFNGFSSPNFWCGNLPNEPAGVICHNTVNPGQNFIHIGDASSNVEGFYLPLCDELEIGCDYTISFMMSAGCTAAVNFAFSQEIPCPFNPGPSVGPALLGGGAVTCNTTPSYTYLAPDIVNIPFTNTDNDGDGAPDWVLVTQTFTATEASDVVTIFPDVGPSAGSLQSLYLDDISVRVDEDDLTVTAQTTTNCLGGNVVVEYTICSGEDDVVLLDLNAALPLINGVSYTNQGDFDNMGNAFVAIPANGCVTLELVLDVLITVLPGTVLDIHLTGDVIAGCGDLEHWHQVIVDGDNQPPFASFDKEIDCGDVIFTSTDQDSGNTHFWDFGDPASGVNNTSTDVNPTHTYGASGTYIVTHTVTNDCGTVTMEMEVEIDLDCTPVCACPPGGYNIGDGGTVNIDDTNLPADELLNSCISVNGILVIDKDYLFDDVEFVMNPEAEIHITGSNNDVEIFNSFLHGCEEMWGSVRILDEATLDFQDNVIRDAEYAIWPTDHSELRVQDNQFIENHVGIYTSPLGGGQFQFIKRFDNERVTGNTFSSPGTLLVPRAGEKSYAGIFLNSTNQFYMGDEDEPSNVFTDSNYGIYAINSMELKMYDNVMSGLNDLAGDGRSNTGIRLWRCTENHIERNDISNVEHGVWSEDSAFRARKQNLIVARRYGIYSARGFDIRIWENDITAGILPTMAQGGSRSSILVRDHIGMADVEEDLVIRDNTTRILGFGRSIRLAFNSSMSEVFDNDVYILGDGNPAEPQYVASGISVTSCQAGQTVIRRNNIYRVAGSVGGANMHSWGILASNSLNLHVVDNNVNVADTNAPAVTQQSINIYVTTCPGINICCNTLDRGNHGIRFFNMNNLANLHTTEFRTHNTALYLQNTQIGPQFNKGNSWTNNSNTDAYHQGPANNLPLNAFLSSPNQPPSGYGKIGVQNGTPQQWFSFQGFDPSCDIWNGDNYCGVPYAQLQPEDPCEVYLTEVDDEAIKSFGQSKLKWKGAYFDANRSTYDRMSKAGPCIEALPQQFLEFYNSQGAQLLEKIWAVKKLQKKVGLGSKEFTENAKKLEELSANLLKLDDQYSASTNQEEQEAIALQMLEWTKVMKEYGVKHFYLLDEKAEKDQSTYNEADAILAGMNTTSPEEKYRSLVDKILLKRAVYSGYEMSQGEMAEVIDIAGQCALSGGAAVYDARSILSEYQHVAYDLDNICESSQQKIAAEAPKANDFMVFPNPSQGQLVISKPEHVKGAVQFQLYSLDGKLIKSLYLEDAKTELDFSNLEAGFYTCKFLQHGKLLESQKIVLF